MPYLLSQKYTEIIVEGKAPIPAVGGETRRSDEMHCVGKLLKSIVRCPFYDKMMVGSMEGSCYMLSSKLY